MGTALKYSLFALVATAVNILLQDISIRVYQGQGALFVSILLGTAIGLVVKYILDKRYIFRFYTDTAKQNSTTFLLYSLMGVFTTVIFWGFEFAFDHIFGSKHMRYLGAVIGLGIGYYIKYQLDKRFVFVERVQS